MSVMVGAGRAQALVNRPPVALGIAGFALGVMGALKGM